MKNELFNKLLASLQEMDDIFQGKKATARVTKFPEPEVKLIRKKIGLSQNRFAMLIGVSKRTLENWEQGVGLSLSRFLFLMVFPGRRLNHKR
ncbi:MAG: helix-turn-helix domain-containing protein [Nitrospira sp. SB0677_bin_15]|nr:helix-turn-helix domain-containing protein [Nitrospira sp. SB0677_bin_15]